ncbi:flagellar protein FlaG [Candidatus Clostridium radicumherbarum]|uniref:Flagellar protein FlaG n=1 Tax=Candidatus Clostridium radicumherbarum TaxID=3381662 RepID=A0ABW8U0T7_9CLOT
MEIGALGQGGQVSLNVNKGADSECVPNIAKNSDNIKTVENNTNEYVSKDKINEKNINKAIDKINKFLEDNKTHAEYEIHDKFKDIMIKIVDDKTGQVIQELPPKKLLDMVAKMCELVGVLFDKKA